MPYDLQDLGSNSSHPLSPESGMSRGFRTRRIVVAFALAVLSAAGVAAAVAAAHEPGADSEMVLGDAHSFVSQETASDVVTFADAVLVVKVIGEQKVEDDRIYENEDGSANGAVPRQVQLQVESVLWSGNGEHDPPKGVFSVETWGWYVQETETRPFRVRGEERLSVDERYMVPIGWDGAEWTPLLGASFHLADGGVVPLDDQESELSEKLSKVSEEDLSEFFARVEPLEGSEPFLTLPLRDRADAYYGQARAGQDDADQDRRN